MLPDFTRIAWASAEARAYWQPRISAASSAWLNVELASVEGRVRPSALQTVPDASLPALEARAAKAGLVVVRLQQQSMPTVYASSAPAGGTGAWRVAVTRAELEPAWREAWARGDNEAIGGLLGFPTCCTAFFGRTWGRGMVDGTLQMAGTPGENVACNILGRWLGVRLVPHLPCSWECSATVVLANRLRQFWPADEWRTAVDFLSMAVDYSALHGAAEVKWPVVKVVARTDYTASRRSVLVPGDRDVPGAPPGLCGNNRPPSVIPISSLRSFARSVDAADPRTWTDNGFASLEAMEAAHAPIVQAARQSGPYEYVLDLGCGNGRLVRQLGAQPFGVEIDKDRAARAVVPVVVADVRQAAIAPGLWNLVVLMPGRVVEMSAADAEAFRARLRQGAPRLLVYAYGDWLARYGSVLALAEAAGFRTHNVVTAADSAVVLEDF